MQKWWLFCVHFAMVLLFNYQLEPWIFERCNIMLQSRSKAQKVIRPPVAKHVSQTETHPVFDSKKKPTLESKLRSLLNYVALLGLTPPE